MRPWAVIVILIVIAIAIFVAVALITRVEKVKVSEDWPMFRHDPANTGYTDVEGPDDNHVLWAFKVEISEVWAPPTVANGRVYVPEVGGITSEGIQFNYLYCLNARDGELIWKKEIGPNASAPAVVGGRVYIGGGYDNQIHAFNAENGERIWSYTLPEPALASPTVVNGKVFFPTTQELYSLDANTGSLTWKTWRGRGGYSVAIVENRIYGGVPFNSLSAENGESIWVESPIMGFTGYSIPVVEYGKVYIAALVSENKFYALDAETGEEVWSYDALVRGAPAIGNNRILIPTENGLYCLDAATGDLIWKFDNWYVSSPIIAKDKVYVGYSGGVAALSLENGEMLWSYWGNREEFWSITVGGLAVADGRFFVGSHSGHVIAFGSV